MKNRNVGATIGHLLASLREGGGFCVAKDGRSLRYVRLKQASCQRFFDLLFIINEKEKGEVSENHIVFEDSFAFGFFCLISLVSSFAKEETRETRRKEKKEERLQSVFTL